MKREAGLKRLQNETFDILIIGGGATGLGCAVDAASRGYRTALVEAADFANETSSKSTKLIHGGVRYLRQGNLALIRESLTERATLLRNAPDLVHMLPFLVPATNVWERAYYRTGLRLYDLLARAPEFVSATHGTAAARAAFPNLKTRNVCGAIVYWDASFDDARLAIALAQTAVHHGAAVVNYVRVTSLLLINGRVHGVRASDEESGETFEIRAGCVINATGVFADTVRRMSNAAAAPILSFSRGSHIVVPGERAALRETALLVPRTIDGRVIFIIPWHGRALIGTTDVAVERASSEPSPTAEEIAYLLKTANAYLDSPIDEADLTACFAGLRPLIARSKAHTARLSREHLVAVDSNGLVTIAGGKWTTYRRMAQDAVDAAAAQANLPPAACRTGTLALARVPAVPELEHAVRFEMARSVMDLLARRRRTLIVDTREALAQAPHAAAILSQHLGRTAQWQRAEVDRFAGASRRYTIDMPREPADA